MSSKQNILVRLKDAGFRINDKWLVKGVSLQIEKGKIVTLIGTNGSGKSTTAKIALGIYKKGSARWSFCANKSCNHKKNQKELDFRFFGSYANVIRVK